MRKSSGRTCYEFVLSRGAEFSGIILDPVAQEIIPPEHVTIHLGLPYTLCGSIDLSDDEIPMNVDAEIVVEANRSC